MDIDEEHLYKLVFHVFYPGILGAVLITYLRRDLPLFVETVLSGVPTIYPRFYFGLVFIFHWSLIYVLYTSSFRDDRFGWASFVAYSLLSLFMLSAFYSLPITPTGDAEYLYLYLSVTGIAVPFVALDLYRRRTPGDNWAHPSAHNVREHVIDLSLLVWGTGFSVAHELGPPIHGNSLAAYVFITGTLVASILTINEHV